MPKYYEDYENRYKKVYGAGMSFWRHDHDKDESPKIEISKTVNSIIKSGCIPSSPAQLIDLGCGEGWWSIIWAENGYTVTGVDVASSAIAKARQLADKEKEQIIFTIADVLNLSNVQTESYDIVFESQCFHHMIYDRDRSQCFREAFRITRNGGVLVTKSGWSANGFDEKIETPEDVERLMKPTYERFQGHTYRQKYIDESGRTKEVEVDIIPARTKTKDAAIKDFESVGFELVKTIENSTCLVFRKS
jgi:ubiquinone/menaquinone biosynthesis C-methylase UbiE